MEETKHGTLGFN